MEEYLHVVKQGQHIYFLNAKGREMVDCKKVRKGNYNLMHFVMRNALYIGYGMPESWKNELKITSKGKIKKDTVTNIADAHFMLNNTHHIVEVDNIQKMSVNRQKIDRYRTLIERGTFGPNLPVLIWITTTELRRRQLTEACTGIITQVFTASDFI